MYIFAGDINIDLLDTDVDSTNDYLTVMQRYGFFSGINKATRKVDNSGTCLDHYFIKCNNNLFQKINAVILEHKLTDHDPILLNIPLENNNIPNKKENSYQIVNYEKLGKMLEREGWENVLQTRDPNQSTESFVIKLKNMISMSTKTRIISNRKRRLKPWITGGLLVSIRKRDTLKKECTLNRNNLALLNKYKNYRKMLSKLTQKAKYFYYKKLAQKNSGDPKKLWKVIKEATNDYAQRVEVKTIVNSDNIELTDKKLIADEFNSFFTSIGKKLADNITPCINGNGERGTVNSFLLTPSSRNEILIQIQSLKNGVKGGEDCICSDIVNRFKEILIKPLYHIVNIVFGAGVFPEILKSTVVIPLYKQGDRKSINNYRPIALTSTISKIIEKCFRFKLLKYLEKNKLLHANQFAFREHSSTENALCRVTETILKNLDNGKKVIGIFLDLQKAFDTVAHPILLERLDQFGIRGIPRSLVKSYLGNRKQSVIISGVESNRLEVEFGVPQGTVLSTLLFNIYINDLMHVLDDIFCFADDSGAIVCGDDWDSTKNNAELALQKIKKWLDSSLLSLNVSKTKFLTFSLSSRMLPSFQVLKIHNPRCDLGLLCNCDKWIERKPVIKYLGVMIDETFNWKEHIRYVTGKIRKLIYKFYELRNILAFSSLKMVYFALIESVINYGIVVWGNAGTTIMSKLMIAQKWVIKVILFKKKRYPTELVYRDSGLLSPSQLYIKAVIRFMLKTTYYRENILHGVNTRNAAQNNLVLCNPRHSLCQKHIYYIGPKIYNSLPQNIRSRPYHKVKKEIVHWILETDSTVTYMM